MSDVKSEKERAPEAMEKEFGDVRREKKEQQKQKTTSRRAPVSRVLGDKRSKSKQSTTTYDVE